MTERRHIRLSIALLVVFMASGLVLETVLGLRLEGWVDDPIRREFLRLGHAHGGLLALVGLIAAWAMTTLKTPPGWARPTRLALVLSSPLVGGGFVAGGLWHGPTDPGPLVLLVPGGALMALAALVVVAVARPSQQG